MPGGAQLELFFEPSGDGKYVAKAGGYFIPGKIIARDVTHEETITVKEAMRRLSYSKSTIHFLCATGELEFRQRDARCKKRLVKASVERLAERMRARSCD